MPRWGTLVRMVLQILQDMVPFMLVLLVFLVMFTTSFWIILQVRPSHSWPLIGSPPSYQPERRHRHTATALRSWLLQPAEFK